MDGSSAESVRLVFQQFDTNGDGCISSDELRAVIDAVQNKSFTEEELNALFAAIDTNSDGKIQIGEFINWLNDETKSWTDVCASAVGPTLHSNLKKQVAREANRQCEGIGILIEDEEPDFVEALKGLSLLDAKALRSIFQNADVDRNGWLALDELQRLLYPEAETSSSLALSKVFVQMDKNGDGKIRCAEFVSYVLELHKTMSSVASNADKRQIAAAFNNADADKSGGVTLAELTRMLGANTAAEMRLAQDVFEKVDKNSDGVISIREFSSLYGKELVQESKGIEVEWKEIEDEDSDE